MVKLLGVRPVRTHTHIRIAHALPFVTEAEFRGAGIDFVILSLDPFV